MSYFAPAFFQILDTVKCPLNDINNSTRPCIPVHCFLKNSKEKMRTITIQHKYSLIRNTCLYYTY